MSVDVYLNGEFLPAEQARVPVTDRGFLFGDGVYEVIPVYGGRLFELQRHLQRLDNSLRGIRMANPHGNAQWREILQRLTAQFGDADQAIYLQVTRGCTDIRDHAIPPDIEPTVYARSRLLQTPTTAEKRRGIRAITLDDPRWKRCDIKAVTLLANVLARSEAAEAGAQEAILVRDGLAIEGAASNLFIVSDGLLITPPKSTALLPGITREIVLDLAGQHGIPYAEANIGVQALFNADEIWVSSSTKEILPVLQLNGASITGGVAGERWEQLNALYEERKQQPGRDEEADG